MNPATIEEAACDAFAAATIFVMGVDAAVFGGRCLLRWNMLDDAIDHEPEIGDRTKELLAAAP